MIFYGDFNGILLNNPTNPRKAIKCRRRSGPKNSQTSYKSLIYYTLLILVTLQCNLRNWFSHFRAFSLFTTFHFSHHFYINALQTWNTKSSMKNRWRLKHNQNREGFGCFQVRRSQNKVDYSWFLQDHFGFSMGFQMVSNLIWFCCIL